jgi:hypothetical protein
MVVIGKVDVDVTVVFQNLKFVHLSV